MLGKLLVGIAVGSAAKVAWDSIPYTHADTGGWKLTRYHTILTAGVNLRGRLGGRLYSVDLWREHERD
jgi:hypothetical protein